MTSDDLEREFAARRVPYRGGLLLLNVDDALDLIHRAEEELVPILGVDGFFVTPHETVSPLEHIADYSTAFGMGSGSWEKASGFVEQRRSTGLAFEITLGE